jgi:uncharacterized protein
VRKISELIIYPIKGLRGISLQNSDITPLGLKYDRRYMLVQSNGTFISQRDFPQLTLLSVLLSHNGFVLFDPKSNSSLELPFEIFGSTRKVKIWDDTVDAIEADNKYSEWFSNVLNVDCSLVYLPSSSSRLLDPKYNRGEDLVSFADGFPFLLIGKSSLDFLNKKLYEPIPMDRFRPNIVFEGGVAFEEDTFLEISVGSNRFFALKPCARCAVPTINQQNGIKGVEPTKTLAAFRQKDNKIYFGENLVLGSNQTQIAVGDLLEAISFKDGLF